MASSLDPSRALTLEKHEKEFVLGSYSQVKSASTPAQWRTAVERIGLTVVFWPALTGGMVRMTLTLFCGVAGSDCTAVRLSSSPSVDTFQTPLYLIIVPKFEDRGMTLGVSVADLVVSRVPISVFVAELALLAWVSSPMIEPMYDCPSVMLSIQARGVASFQTNLFEVQV